MASVLEMPTSGVSLQEFEPERVDYSAPEQGGRVGGVTAGEPLWRAVYTIGRVGARKSDELRAWKLRMRGSQRRFYGRDLARPFPLAHINGFSGGFTGAASSWSETINGDTESRLTLNGVQSGMVLSQGDYVDFRWTTSSEARRALVRVVVGATASGTTITVTVEPPVPTLVPVGAVAHLDNPACIMVLMNDQSKLDAIDRRLAVRGGTIMAIQDLRP